MTMNIQEIYPSCAGCPRIAAWEQSISDMNQAFERADITESLRRTETTFSVEETQDELDQRFATFLDRVESGSVPDEQAREAQELYGEVASVAALLQQMAAEKAQQTDTIRQFLGKIAEREAVQLADNCRGVRNFNLLGQTVVQCRSRMKRYAINPPPSYIIED